MAKKQSRAFMFTLNNPVRSDIPKDWFDAKDVVFVVWQEEWAPQTHTPHLQGYCITKANPKSKAGFTIKWCKENLNGKAHWEARMGSHKQAVQYCTKDESRGGSENLNNDIRKNLYGPWTLGEWKDQEETRSEVGERSKKVNLLDVKAAIDAGATEGMLWEKHFSQMLRYGNGFKNYQLVKSAGTRVQPFVIVLWGEPGCGKSAKALEIATANGGGHWFSSTNDKAWWDGYNPHQHKVVVFDDFKGGIPYTTLLRVLDRYPLQVEGKGYTLQFNPAVIVITSNFKPNEWYFQGQADANFDCSALLRRLEAPYGKTIEMKKTPGFKAPEDQININEVFDDICNGAFFKELAKEVDAAKSLIDLTNDEDFDQEEIAEAERRSLAQGEGDDHYDCHGSFYSSDEDLTGRAVSITNDLDRDFNKVPHFVKASTLRRTDTSSLAFNTPLNKAGAFKKIGPQPVQTQLTWTRKRKVINNDDDGSEEIHLPIYQD